MNQSEATQARRLLEQALKRDQSMTCKQLAEAVNQTLGEGVCKADWVQRAISAKQMRPRARGLSRLRREERLARESGVSLQEARRNLAAGYELCGRCKTWKPSSLMNAAGMCAQCRCAERRRKSARKQAFVMMQRSLGRSDEEIGLMLGIPERCVRALVRSSFKQGVAIERDIDWVLDHLGFDDARKKGAA